MKNQGSKGSFDVVCMQGRKKFQHRLSVCIHGFQIETHKTPQQEKKDKKELHVSSFFLDDDSGEREQQFKDETQAPESTRNVANPVSGQSEPSENNEEQPSASGEDSVKRARKGRTIYKAQQVYVLEEIFWRTHYPDPEVIETLARDLEISENKIKVSALFSSNVSEQVASVMSTCIARFVKLNPSAFVLNEL